MSNEIVIKINSDTFANLQVFLNRTDVKGHEVPAFVEIMNALHTATRDKKEKDVV